MNTQDSNTADAAGTDVTGAPADAAGAADAAGTDVTRTPADAAGAADAAGTEVTMAPADAAGAADAAGTDVTETPADAAGAADAAGTDVTMAPADAAGAADAAGTDVTMAPADAAGAADAAGTDVTGTPADAAGAADAAGTDVTGTPADAAGIADAAGTDVTGTPADAAGAADAAGTDVTMAPADAAGAADAAGTDVTGTPADAAGIADAAGADMTGAPPDAAGIADAAGTDVPGALADTAGIAVAVGPDVTVAPADAAGIADATGTDVTVAPAATAGIVDATGIDVTVAPAATAGIADGELADERSTDENSADADTETDAKAPDDANEGAPAAKAPAANTARRAAQRGGAVKGTASRTRHPAAGTTATRSPARKRAPAAAARGPAPAVAPNGDPTEIPESAAPEPAAEQVCAQPKAPVQDTATPGPAPQPQQPPPPAPRPAAAKRTVTGHRGLDLEEPLIFEQDSPGSCGVDLPPLPAVDTRLGGLQPRGHIGLPALSEPTVVRHYTRLSRRIYGIDMGPVPLGSCTMKHNPRLNEKMARLAGFADLHPLQPTSTVQGALALIHELGGWLIALTGMSAVAMAPAAGAHGEFCGLMAIRAALEHRERDPSGAGAASGPDDGRSGTGGIKRRRVLVAESAHGTNPATAAACGFTVEAVPATASGRIDLTALAARLGDDVAALMLTNPNTCGLFESNVREAARLVHEAGGYLYCDGANFNALVGRVRPGELGVDAMHINLHKTFSTPHGGGGPGAGPVVFSAALAPYAPLPHVVQGGRKGRYRLVERPTDKRASGCEVGRLKAFHGQMGMFVRAFTYVLSLGADGLHQASGDAVLSANYLLAHLRDVLSAPFAGPCMHEVLFDDRSLAGTGVTTLDLAKGLIDEGFHPMTVYFPLVVHGAMLIEPTETEPKAALDQLIAAQRGLAETARSNPAALKAAPELAPRRRLDETAAARKPVLRWRPTPTGRI